MKQLSQLGQRFISLLVYTFFLLAFPTSSAWAAESFQCEGLDLLSFPLTRGLPQFELRVSGKHTDSFGYFATLDKLVLISTTSERRLLLGPTG